MTEKRERSRWRDEEQREKKRRGRARTSAEIWNIARTRSCHSKVKTTIAETMLVFFLALTSRTFRI